MRLFANRFAPFIGVHLLIVISGALWGLAAAAVVSDGKLAPAGVSVGAGAVLALLFGGVPYSLIAWPYRPRHAARRHG